MILLALFVSTALAVIALIALINAATFPRLHRIYPGQKAPFVSVLIPARNEATGIGEVIRALQMQDYPNFEILVLDDNSTDGTAAAIDAAGEDDGRTRRLIGEPLPPGWLGKNWACSQLAAQARGDILVFTDADVHWTPPALSAAVSQMNSSRADLLTVWPTQITESWAERLVVPLMALAVMGYLPPHLARDPRRPSAAAANGQCMIFQSAAYGQIDGHNAVRKMIVEDVALARRIKRCGCSLRMADAAGMISCRMYKGWSQLFDGYAKNILAGHGDSLLLLAASTLFHLLLFVWPWAWFMNGFRDANPQWGWPIWPLILIGLGVAARMITAIASRQRPGDALLMPLSVLLMTIIAARAVSWRLGDGPVWKGRTLQT